MFCDVPQEPFVGEVVCEFKVKFAPTTRFCVRDIEQVPVPEHTPDQPVNVEPDDGVPVRVAVEPVFQVTEQVDPQLTVPPPDTTVPDPVPDLDTTKLYVGILIAHDAVVPPFAPVHCQRY
jgi:hypothetical protein